MITAKKKKKKARVKLCQYNSLISTAKRLLVWRKCVVSSLILGYRYLQGRKPGNIWQIRELGHLNQSGADVLCMPHYLTQKADSVNIWVCVEKFVLYAQVQDGWTELGCAAIHTAAHPSQLCCSPWLLQSHEISRLQKASVPSPEHQSQPLSLPVPWWLLKSLPAACPATSSHSTSSLWDTRGEIKLRSLLRVPRSLRS